MHDSESSPVSRRVITTHDGQQHCTAERKPDGSTVAMDCPYTGKGEEFSPTNMVEAAIGGCMLLSMGPQAMSSNLDISGTQIEVKVSMADKPRMRFGSIDITVRMPEGLSEKHRRRLERAAEYCPIKHSFDSNIPISVKYVYPH